MKVTYQGTVTLVKDNNEPYDWVYLGGLRPLVTDVRQMLNGMGDTAHFQATIEGCTPKEASGALQVDVCTWWGADRCNHQTEVLAVGGKDVIALLRQAAGRRCKITFQVPAP